MALIKEGNIMTTYENRTALSNAGYRERYAMLNGTETVSYNGNHRIITFKYSNSDPYQDANGAMYDATEERWVN